MASFTQQSYNASVYELIDAAITANASGIQAELQKNSFSFPYGQNGQLAEKYLLQLYQSNPSLFWEILSNVRIDTSKIPPAQRDRLTALVASDSPSKRIGDYYQQALNYLKDMNLNENRESVGSTPTPVTFPTTTNTPISEREKKTPIGMYVIYAVIGIVIIGIIVYFIRKK